MTYQFTIKPWNQKSWPKEPQEQREIKNFQSAKDLARVFAIKYRADVRFNVKGHNKLHYYRLTDLTKKKLIERDAAEKGMGGNKLKLHSQIPFRIKHNSQH